MTWRRLFDVIALVQDHLKSGVQQACWDINDHICFCLLRIALLKGSCMCSDFIPLNPPAGSESACTGQLWWGGFLYYFDLFCIPHQSRGTPEHTGFISLDWFMVATKGRGPWRFWWIHFLSRELLVFVGPCRLFLSCGFPQGCWQRDHVDSFLSFLSLAFC